MKVCNEYLFGQAKNQESGASDLQKKEEEEHERKRKGITRRRPDGGVKTQPNL